MASNVNSDYNYDDNDLDLGYIDIITENIEFEKLFEHNDRKFNKYIKCKENICENVTQTQTDQTLCDNNVIEVPEEAAKHASVSSSRIFKDNQQFYEMIVNKNGKPMYGCKWKDCEFGITSLRNLILRHIYIEHFKLKCSKPNCGQTFKDLPSFTIHLKSHIRSDDKKVIDMMPKMLANNEKNRKLVIKSQTNANYLINAKYNSNRSLIGSNNPHKDMSKSIYAGVFSAKNVEQYRKRLFVNGKYIHRCKWNDCDFETHSSDHIVQHIHIKHIGIKEQRCSVPGCGKVYKTPKSLARHLKCHLCGYRINTEKYKLGKGMCSKYNLNKYYKRVQITGVSHSVNNYTYHCQWPHCISSSSSSKDIEIHVHSQHICPNRVGEKSFNEILELLEISNSEIKIE